MNGLEIRRLLTGGDRRSIADSNRVRRMIENAPSLVSELAALTKDYEWLIVQRALDLLEKIAHDHRDWVEPHKKIFLGPLAESDKWEIRLQIVRALPLFQWTPAQSRRVEEILLANVEFPQTFVRAWSLDSLAALVRVWEFMPSDPLNPNWCCCRCCPRNDYRVRNTKLARQVRDN